MKKEVNLRRTESIFDYWKKLETDPLFENYLELIQNHPLIKSLSLLTSSTFVIFDHVNVRYAYIEESLKKYTGYDNEKIYKEGWEASKDVFPTEYFEFSMNCHRLIFDHLYSLPIECRNKVIFCKDYLFYNPQHEVLRCLQKGMVLKSDTKGNIQLTLHLLEDITHLKKKHSANLVIGEPSISHSIYLYDASTKIMTNYGNLSNREIEILTLIANGIDSKSIGDRLNISNHTVDTHRRNMLSKLNCIDTTALVTYCKMVQII